MSIKVISQNVMCWERKDNSYRKRRKMLRRVFDLHGADLIGLQEVTPTWKKYFEEDLEDFENIFKYRAKESFEAVPIYWKKEKFNKIDGGWFWLSETPEVSSRSWGTVCIRITTWVCLEEKATGKRFAFVNTHLDHVSEKARVEGIKLIVRFIEEKFGKDMPLILTGDFNATPDSETIRIANELLRNTRDIAKVTTDEITWHAYGESDPQIIDYVFVSNGVKCTKFEVIKETDGDTVQSDHYAVGATLEM